MGKKAIVAGGVMLSATLVVIAFILFRPPSSSPIPRSIQKSISHPLYVPTDIPKEWNVAKDSAKVSRDIVVYSVATGHGDIVVTQQPLPPSTFDFDAFYSKGLSGAVPFSTKRGTAAIGKANGRFTGSLVAGDTWILLSTSSSDIRESDMRSLLENLQPLN